MAQSYYSFYGSRLILILEDAVAEAYNRRAKEFIDAQVRYEEKYGKKWTPDEPLPMRVDKESQKAWNKIADLINLMCEINGGGLEIPEEELVADYLVKVEV